MRKQHMLHLAFLLLAVTTFMAVYFFIRSAELKEKLELSRAQISSEYKAEPAAFFTQLVATDSMVLKENYSDARLAYERLSQEIQKDHPLSQDVQLRIYQLDQLEGMREKLRSLQEQEPDSGMLADNRQLDSLLTQLAISERVHRDQFDSLNFA